MIEKQQKYQASHQANLIKTIKYQWRKHIEDFKILKPAKNQNLKSIEDIFSKDQSNNEIKKEFNQIKNGKTPL